jgi:hypothetical protein
MRVHRSIVRVPWLEQVAEPVVRGEDRSSQHPAAATYPVGGGPQRNSRLNLTGQPCLAMEPGAADRYLSPPARAEASPHELAAGSWLINPGRTGH